MYGNHTSVSLSVRPYVSSRKMFDSLIQDFVNFFPLIVHKLAYEVNCLMSFYKSCGKNGEFISCHNLNVTCYQLLCVHILKSKELVVKFGRTEIQNFLSGVENYAFNFWVNKF